MTKCDLLQCRHYFDFAFLFVVNSQEDRIIEEQLEEVHKYVIQQALKIEMYSFSRGLSTMHMHMANTLMDFFPLFLKVLASDSYN